MRSLLLLLLLCTLTFFAGLGRGAISDSDEAFYAEAGREMVQSGNWLTPHYNYEHRFQKPILFYWLVAIAYVAAGVSESAARFWAAASALGLVVLTYHAARRWYDEATGLAAGAIAATSLGHVALARLALPDLPLALFVSVAVVAMLHAMFDTQEHALRWSAVAGVAAALAVLAKGPVGLALPLLVVGGIGLADRRGWQLLPWHAGVAILLCAAVAAPWYLAMALRHGPAYLTGFFVGDNLERFATSRFNDPRPAWFYLPIVAGGLAPWTPFLFLWLAPLARLARRRRRLSGLEARLVLWVTLPLLFFTVSVGKQPRYVLPLLPPLSILLARALVTRAARADPSRRADRLLQTCGVVASLLVVAVAGLFFRAKPLLIVNSSPALINAGFIAMLGAGAVVGGVALSGSRRSLWPALAASTAVTVLALQYAALSIGGPDPVERMAAAIKTHRQAQEPVGARGVMVRNLVFYTGVKQTELFNEKALADFLERRERVLCVLSAEDEARLGKTNTRIRRLAALRHFNVSAARLRTLLWPDPGRDLETVVLVTNE